MLNSNKIQNSCKCHFFDVKMAFHKTQHIKSATFTYGEREESKSKCAWNGNAKSWISSWNDQKIDIKFVDEFLLWTLLSFLLLEAMIGSAPEYYKVEVVCSTLVPCLMLQSAGKYRQTTNIQMLHWSWRGCTELKASERENLPSIFFSSLILVLK